MKCYQCGTCTADCTYASVDDSGRFNPRRMVLDYFEKGKISELCWLCATCFKCYRCPKDVKPYEVLAEMRAEHIRKGKIPAHVKAFVETVRSYGELDEAVFFLKLMKSGKMMDFSIVVSSLKNSIKNGGLSKTISIPKKSPCAEEVSKIFSIIEGSKLKVEKSINVKVEKESENTITEGVPA
ncbi:MAG: hypothetical protein DSY33_00085 [Archaeoglobus sp.]|jgi:heterodisulfide reductase subunit C|nr:MAG: hypothetical protein DSY33_00085 [Archaeoglobus sp.]